MRGDLRETNDKFMRGDSLSNPELLELLSAYSVLEKTMERMVDASFNLFLKEVRSRHETLKGFKEARGV